MNEFTGVLGVVGSISGKRTFSLVMGLECFIPGLKPYMERFERELSSKNTLKTLKIDGPSPYQLASLSDTATGLFMKS